MKREIESSRTSSPAPSPDGRALLFCLESSRSLPKALSQTKITSIFTAYVDGSAGNLIIISIAV